MTEPLPENIEKLLQDLLSEDAYRRRSAAETVAELRVTNEQIITALKTVAASDPNRYVREAAIRALDTLGFGLPPDAEARSAANRLAPPTPPVLRPFFKQIDFWLGFIGWYLVNGLIWWGFGPGATTSSYGPVPALILLPANVVVLLITAFVRSRFAGGMLAAYALNFVIATFMGATVNATCAIPFFYR